MVALPGCTEGATVEVEGSLPAGFLGGADGNVVSTTDAEPVGDVDESDIGGDTLVGPDAGDTTDVTDDPDVETVSPDTTGADVGADVDDVEPDVPCTPGDPGCGCGSDADCLGEDDGNLCNGRVVCVDGACVEDVTMPSCDGDTGDPCTVSVCDPASGACAVVPTPAGTSCDDGDACTPNDRCEEGVCISSPRLLCDDGNPCTTDSCDAGECEFDPVDALPCDDGNGCTVDDVCGSGICQGTTGDACACEVDADCDGFDDGNACNGTVTCESGSCKVKLSSLVQCAVPEEGDCGVELCDPETGSCDFVKHPNGTGCDDGQPCTVDDQCAVGNCIGNTLECEPGACATAECDSDSGVCAHTLIDDGTECDGSQLCSDGGTCQAGQCSPGVGACPCVADEDCAEHDDDDLCNGSVRCVQGRCALDPETVVTCVADGPCEAATCDATTGECSLDSVADGEGCDDGDACTQADNCVGGECVGETVTCEGDAPCVLADCHPFSGCTTTFVGGACDNGDGCTELASCLAGQCSELTPVICVASHECVDSACDPGAGSCVETANTNDCDDSDACTDGDVCAGGACAGVEINCDDGNGCTTGACVAGACEQNSGPHEGVLCEDGNPCTVGDACGAGVCEGNSLATCDCDEDADCEDLDDDDICTGTLVCVGGACEVDPATVITCGGLEPGPCQIAACDKGDGTCSLGQRTDGEACALEGLCSGDGTCQGGECVTAFDPCDDGNPCTADGCDPAVGCTHVPTPGSCDDGDWCTQSDTCEEGVCVGEQWCICGNDAQCAGQDDADLCNGSFICGPDNYCIPDPDTVVTCDASDNPCLTNVCEPTSGECVPTPLDGVICSDGDACTVGDVCVADVCTSGAAVTCDSEGENPCVESVCDSGTGECVYSAAAESCDDANPCTTDETCLGSACVAATNVCGCSEDIDCDAQLPDKCSGTAVCGPDGCELIEGSAVVCDTSSDTPCATTACVPATGECVTTYLLEGDSCGTEDACVSGSVCTADGACEGNELDCDDGNPCTADSCDSVTGCVNVALADATSCEDGDPICSLGDTCQSGICTSGFNICSCSEDSDCDANNAAAGGDLCSGAYYCDAFSIPAVCRKSDAVTCSLTGKEPCEVNVCNPGNGQCQNTVSPGGTLCDDGNECTVDDACLAGVSICSGVPKNCDDGNPCTINDCTDGECSSETAPDFVTPCEDDDWCTKPAVCYQGGCGIDECDCVDDEHCADEYNDKDDLCAAQHICDIDPDTGAGRCMIDESSAVTCFDDNPYDCIDYFCAPLTGECTPIVRENGTACDDAAGLCTINDVCDSSACSGTPVVTCEDTAPDDCSDYQCMPDTGQCGFIEREAGVVCSDSNACTTGDTCVAGACQGELVACDDGSPCTEDICSASEGCVHKHVVGDCDDGDPCTSGTYCENGTCAGVNVTNSCGGCTDHAECAVYDDDDGCNGSWICDGGTCKHDSDSVIVCTPESVTGDLDCYEGICDPASPGCSIAKLPAGTSCDDTDPCTEYDQCDDGSCTGRAKDCDDGDPCTSDSCDSETGACSNVALNNGQPCDDGDVCNGADTCQEGACVSGNEGLCECTSDAECSAVAVDNCHGSYVCDGGFCRVNHSSVVVCPADPTGCSLNACDPSTGECGSELVPDGTSCNDGVLCTVDDRCTAGVCAGTTVDCTDDNPCTIDHCDDDFGCVHDEFAGVADPLDTGKDCEIYLCVSGTTVYAGDFECDDGNDCTKNNCFEGIGCPFYPQTLGHVPVGGCDNNACTTADHCDGAGGCDATEVCTCAAGACDALNENLCSGMYTCNGSHCVLTPGTVVECAEDEECRSYSCNPDTGSCEAADVVDGTQCAVTDQCLEDATCVAGECVGTPKVCGPSNQCQEKICIPSEGCVNQPQSGSCDDGSLCTSDDRCVEGACEGVPNPEPSITFDDGDLSAWTIDSNGQDVTWKLSGMATTSSPYALHLVNPETGTMNDANGPWLATATLDPITQPITAVNLNIRFRVWADFASDGCSNQTFAVTVNGAQVNYLVRVSGALFGEPEPCVGTGGDFLEGQVSLGDTYQGQTVELGFAVETLNADGNDGGGVIVDDVVFDWTCN